jgi:hypothetical protein
MAEVKLITDGAAMEAMLRGPTGIVARHLIRQGTKVQVEARTKAPVKTGCLQASILKRYEQGPEGLIVRIVCDTTPCSPTRTSYAYFVHEGTKPHVIRARPGGVLAFKWPDGPEGDKVYYLTEVNHPGTKAQPFLRDALPVALL